jgi:hypothetical protein
MTVDNAPLFDTEHAAFMQGGVSITVAACDRANVPAQTRALGCRIAMDRRSITVFVSAPQAAQVIECLREHDAIAVVFSEPSTHRTVQLKGRGVTVGALENGDLQRMADYRAAFGREIAPHGFDQRRVDTLLAHPANEIVTLAFTPTSAFSQTPGPKAGEPLRSAT